MFVRLARGGPGVGAGGARRRRLRLAARAGRVGGVAGMAAVAVDVVDSVAVEQPGTARRGPHGAALAAVIARPASAGSRAELAHERDSAPTCRRGWRGWRIGAYSGGHAPSISQLERPTRDERPALVGRGGGVARCQLHQAVAAGHRQALVAAPTARACRSA